MFVRRTASALAFVAVAGLTMMTTASAVGAAQGGPGPNENAAPQATLVRTDIFLPGPDRGPERDAGRGKPGPGPVPTANCTNDGPTSANYALTGFTSTIADRHARLNTSTVPLSLGVDVAADRVADAFDEWHSFGAPMFTVDRVTSALGGVEKQTANRHTDVLFGRTSGNALAVTYTWHWSDTDEYESDTVFNQSMPWADIDNTTVDGGSDDGFAENVVAYDIQGIATHEFGHIFGLGHPAGERFATMYAYGYTGETLKRSLSLSDITGITSLS